MTKPISRPKNPFFSSGPCAKRPGWSLDALKDAAIARSHRSKPGKTKLAEVLTRSRDLLGLPAGYRIGIVPGSDTGAFEMAMWSMLGARGVDVLTWESFGKGWLTDIQKQLKLTDIRSIEADYGKLPDLGQVDTDRDVVFAWNGTTSGVCVPDGKWIAENREGLTFCDATSAVFAMALPWKKLDVVTYSWQKVMGGEAAHGVLVLGPRAVERLESYTPDRPLPKVFRMTKGGKLIEEIFEGATINTPSLLCVEDAIDALKWMENAGGQEAIIARSKANLETISKWVEKTSWIAFLAGDPSIRSSTSVCFKVEDPWFSSLNVASQSAVLKQMTGALEKEGVAYDIGGYRDAPPGLRIWAGGTVEKADLEGLFPWLDWAFTEVKASA